MASPQPVQQSAPLPDIAGIISGAVIEGLKAAGIFSDAPTASSQENSNQAASVQGSVAPVIQDITGEQNSPTVDQNNSYVTAANISVVCDPLVGAIDRPELVHKPLASRISDKIQSKIWANEYVDFGTLLQSSYANNSKYNFVVQASPSPDHKSGASAKTETYSNNRSMAHSFSNLCSDLCGAVSERCASLNET